jgi:hypothetical protein
VDYAGAFMDRNEEGRREMMPVLINAESRRKKSYLLVRGACCVVRGAWEL